MGPSGKEGRTSQDDGSGDQARQPVIGDRLLPSDQGIRVRPGVPEDADRASELHAEQIADGFLSLLGPPFLRRLYRRIVLSPGSFLFVADDGNRTVGFIAGSTEVTGLYKSFLWHDGIPAAIAAGWHLLRGWRRVLETLRHGSSGGSGVGRGAELLAVAVDPTETGRGVGRLLVSSFLGEVTSTGGDAAHVVVGADNVVAVALYERAGFHQVEHFELHPGTTSLLMQWDRPSPGPPAGDPI